MPQRLYDLIDQLIGISPIARNLRKQFRDNPGAVTANLDDDARAVLYSMSRANISGRVLAEMQADYPNDYLEWHHDWDVMFSQWNFPKKEYPRKDLPKACQGQDGEQTQYPDPQPQVYRIKPIFVKAGTASPFAIEVVGQGFVAANVTLTLKPILGAPAVVLANQAFTGTFRCGHITADLTVPGAVSTPGLPDVYDVAVTVDAGSPGNPKPVPIPSAVTFEVRP